LSDSCGNFAATTAPRTSGTNEGRGKYRVTAMDEAAGTVISESGTGNGAFAVADPRPASCRDGRAHYEAGGHYGVVAWDSPSGTVASSGSYDNMPLSVGDPREALLSDPIWVRPITMALAVDVRDIKRGLTRSLF
jgi:hypothetical protein